MPGYHRRRCLWLLIALALALGGCAGKVAPPVPEPLFEPEEKRVIEHVVGAGESLARIADNYYGEPEKAVEIARDNGLSDPNRIVAGSVLQLRFSAGQWAEAQQRAAALRPYNKGVELLANERVGEAEKQFKLALATAPDLLAAKYNLALVHLKRGRNDRALTLLEELTTERPEDPDFLFARGNALFQSARFDEATMQFAAALSYRPDFKRAAFGLARSYQEGQHPQQAIVAWQAYLELDDDSTWAATARRNLKKLRGESAR